MSMHTLSINKIMQFLNMVQIPIILSLDDKTFFYNELFDLEFDNIKDKFIKFYQNKLCSDPSLSHSSIKINNQEYMFLKTQVYIYKLILLFAVENKALSILDIFRMYPEEMQKLIDCIKIGLWITDGQGKVLTINKECEKTGGLSLKHIKNKTMQELIDAGYIFESISLKALKSGKEQYLIQNCGDGTRVASTAAPCKDKNGNIELVITVERDIAETFKLKKMLEKNECDRKGQHKVGQIDSRSIYFGGLIVNSPKMKRVMETVELVSGLDTTILIEGESGTGKEILTDIIHQKSNRRNHPVVKINCGAIPEHLLESELFGYEKGAFTGATNSGKIGLLELADKGTLFLDEIGDLPLSLQPKLLRSIQNNEIIRVGGTKTISIDVRLISATNKDLSIEVKESRFREDLYYRLKVVPIYIPPLRERREDIAPLSLLFLDKFNEKYGVNKSIDEEVMQMLIAYSWPGNVRELKNVIERAIVTTSGSIITLNTIYPILFEEEGIVFRPPNHLFSLNELVEKYEKELLIMYINKYPSISQMAKALKVDKSTISRKLKKYSIFEDAKDF